MSENKSKSTNESKQYSVFEDFLEQDFAAKDFQLLSKAAQRFIQTQFDNLGFGVDTISQVIESYKDLEESQYINANLSAIEFLEMTLNVLVSNRNLKSANSSDLRFGKHTRDNEFKSLQMPDQAQKGARAIDNDLKLGIGKTKFELLQKEIKNNFENLK